MIKRILLMMPPNSIPVNNTSKRAVPPIGLAYIAAVLEKNGFEVFILDAATEGYDQEIREGNYTTYGLTFDQITEKIKEISPDLVGVSCAFSPQMKNVYKVCNAVKKANKNIITVSGGLHPSVFPEEVLKNEYIDFVIIGEGEYRTLNLIERLNNQKSLKDIDGLAYKKNGKIIIRKQTTVIENLDSLPFPAWHLVNLKKYFKINMPINPFPRGKRVMQILTSRGCPIRCVFCASCNFWGAKYRTRSAENVIEEMKQLKEKLNIDEIQFADDQIILDKNRTIKILQGLKELKFPYCSTPSGLYVNALDEEILDWLKECNCYQITVAIESADPHVQKIIRKFVDTKKAIRLVKYAHKLGISVHAFYVLGNPGETKEQMETTFKFSRELDADSISYYVAQPIPGSDLYDMCLKAGCLREGVYDDLDLKSAEANLSKVNSKELELWVSEETARYNRVYLLRHPLKFFRKYGKFIITKQDSNAGIIRNFISILYNFKKSA